MDYHYIVKYIDSHILDRNDDWKRKGTIDGLNSAKDIEALLLEEHKRGYELVSMTPVTGSAVKPPYAITTTVGFMVTMRKTVDGSR